MKRLSCLRLCWPRPCRLKSLCWPMLLALFLLSQGCQFMQNEFFFYQAPPRLQAPAQPGPDGGDSW